MEFARYGIVTFLENVMRAREASNRQCAHCGEPLTFNESGALLAWRVGNLFVCNEFCADGISDEGTGHEVPPPDRLRPALSSKTPSLTK